MAILEGLSRRTAWTDLHDKLRDCDATPAVRHYVVVARDGLDGQLALSAIDATLRMREIYEGLGSEPEAETP